MKINLHNLVPITEANQNFSRIAKIVDVDGTVVIVKNNKPRYLLIEFSQAEEAQTTDDEDISEIVKHIIHERRSEYKELIQKGS